MPAAKQRADHLALTEEGEAYHRGAIAVLQHLSEIDSRIALTKALLEGRVRVEWPDWLATMAVIPALPDFAQRYPHIELDMRINNKSIDLVAENVDCVLRVGPILAARQLSAAQAAVGRLQQDDIDARAVQLDVTDERSIAAAVETLGHWTDHLDALVNNAGIMLDRFDAVPSQQSMETWRRTFDTNVFGAVAVTSAFLPLLRRAASGRIVNVSSILGSMAANVDPTSSFYDFKIPAYNTSKSALNAWTFHLAYELRDTPIKVNAAHPGFVKTDLHGVDAPMSPEEGAQTSVREARRPRHATDSPGASIRSKLPPVMRSFIRGSSSTV